ncbi:hypothetical protein [Mesorhizobium sp. M0815]
MQPHVNNKEIANYPLRVVDVPGPQLMRSQIPADRPTRKMV